MGAVGIVESCLVVRRVLLVLIACALVVVPEQPARATDLHNVLTDYVITSWNNKEGLPPGVVWTLAQDEDGYLWVGNDAGLFRFDGERFVAWNALSSTPVPSMPVRALSVARDRSLWIGFGGNAGVGHLVNGRLRQFAEADGLGPGAVVVMIEDRNGGIWAGSNSGLYRFENDRFSRQTINASGQPTAILSALLDASGALLFGTASGLVKADPPYLQFKVVKATDDAVRAIADDGHGGVWISDAVTGLRVSSDGPSNVHHYDSPADRGRGMRLLRDRRGNMWTATGGQGLWRLRLDDREDLRSDRDVLKSVSHIERATSLTGLL